MEYVINTHNYTQIERETYHLTQAYFGDKWKQFYAIDIIYAMYVGAA